MILKFVQGEKRWTLISVDSLSMSPTCVPQEDQLSITSPVPNRYFVSPKRPGDVGLIWMFGSVTRLPCWIWRWMVPLGEWHIVFHSNIVHRTSVCLVSLLRFTTLVVKEESLIDRVRKRIPSCLFSFFLPCPYNESFQRYQTLFVVVFLCTGESLSEQNLNQS